VAGSGGGRFGTFFERLQAELDQFLSPPPALTGVQQHKQQLFVLARHNDDQTASCFPRIPGFHPDHALHGAEQAVGRPGNELLPLIGCADDGCRLPDHSGEGLIPHGVGRQGGEVFCRRIMVGHVEAAGVLEARPGQPEGGCLGIHPRDEGLLIACHVLDCGQARVVRRTDQHSLQEAP